jgi:iron(III) transport system permease protein
LQIARELEEAGAVCGAGGLQSFRRIVLPLMAPAVTTAWLFVLLLSVRSIGLPILLAGPNAQVVAVTIFDLWGNGQTVQVAAIGLVWAVLMMSVGVLFHLATRGRGLAL